MIVLTAQYLTKPGDTEDILKDLQEMTQIVLINEPGCLTYRVHRNIDNPDQLLIYEAYQDMASVHAHSETDYFKRLVLERIVPKLIHRERTLWDS